MSRVLDRVSWDVSGQLTYTFTPRYWPHHPHTEPDPTSGTNETHDCSLLAPSSGSRTQSPSPGRSDTLGDSRVPSSTTVSTLGPVGVDTRSLHRRTGEWEEVEVSLVEVGEVCEEVEHESSPTVP